MHTGQKHNKGVQRVAPRLFPRGRTKQRQPEAKQQPKPSTRQHIQTAGMVVCMVVCVDGIALRAFAHVSASADFWRDRSEGFARKALCGDPGARRRLSLPRPTMARTCNRCWQKTYEGSGYCSNPSCVRVAKHVQVWGVFWKKISTVTNAGSRSELSSGFKVCFSGKVNGRRRAFGALLSSGGLCF